MKTVLSLEYTHTGDLPEGHTNEVRTPDPLVEHVLREYTDPGDDVLDIFAGYGTTLTVGERLGRTPWGVEYDAERAAYIRERLSEPENVRQGDARNLKSSWVPRCECCFTSPPFMERTDDRNPFRNYAGSSTYEAYLDDIETAFSRLDSVLAPGGHAVVDISNIKHNGQVTTLAWDVADRISNVFHFEGEVVVSWNDEDESADERDGQFGYGYDHSYCLVFSKPNP